MPHNDGAPTCATESPPSPSPAPACPLEHDPYKAPSSLRDTTSTDDKEGTLMPWSFEAAARYGWTPDEELSEDENVMDLVLLVTRTSRLRQGGMACVLVRPPEDPISCDGGGARHNNTSLLRGRIAVVATNGSLYEADSSDIHAEIAAVATAAGHGIPTRNATAYITMPPCKRCFAALVMSGVRRVVSRHPCRSAAVQKAAFASGVELVVQEETAEQRGRLASLAKGK